MCPSRDRWHADVPHTSDADTALKTVQQHVVIRTISTWYLKAQRWPCSACTRRTSVLTLPASTVLLATSARDVHAAPGGEQLCGMPECQSMN